jgi:nucleotide-binding universal stress UspA family protein
MKKILLAVDNTKGSEQAAKTVASWAKAFRPESIVLLNVQRLFGQSIIGEALESDQDIEEVNEALEGSELMAELNAKSDKILTYFTGLLRQAGYGDIKSVVKQGHPAEQILDTAKEEGVDLIVVGSRGGRFHNLLLGSVSREVTNTADISVLVAR